MSWHIKDLMGRDISVTQDVIAWLAPTDREIRNRSIPKRLMARLQAAVLLTNALKGENSGLLTHILDRTEGKVAEPRGPATPALLALHIDLSGHSLGTSPMQVIDITPTYQALTDGESNGEAQPSGELAPVVHVQAAPGPPGLPLSRDSKGEGEGGDSIPILSSSDSPKKIPWLDDKAVPMEDYVRRDPNGFCRPIQVVPGLPSTVDTSLSPSSGSVVSVERRDHKSEPGQGGQLDTTSPLPPEIQQVCENAAKVLADKVAERMAPVFEPPVKRKRGRPRKETKVD